MSVDYVRLCPTCGNENPPATLRCPCGALLAGIDLTARVALDAGSARSPETGLEKASTAAPTLRCPQADCGMPNPPDAARCLYCDRPMSLSEAGLSGTTPATPSLLQLPTPLRTRYTIVRILPATGAEAELLIVQPTDGDAECIAKIYRHGIHPNPEVQRRIADILPAHRVRLIEAGIADGFAYEVMEYCQAGSLRDWLRRERPTAPQLRNILQELSTAIAAVHAADLIHRDLKPENILIRQAEPLDLVLTDFGIASVQNATVRFTGVARTLAYAAPESLSGVIDGKTDWWSLGMILLEALLGTHPFAGLSDAVILHQLTTRSIDTRAVDDPDWRKLLSGLLQRDPRHRWAEVEIRQWLVDPGRLANPAIETAGLQAGQPYRLCDDLCHTAEQLAVALSNHWPQAVADLDNGLLMTWLRTELKDQNLVRFLIDLNLQRSLHIDVRLLRLIIHLAPGIPPVWRGESLSLRNILRWADRALKQEAVAIDWLEALRTHEVLEAYAAAGNPEICDLLKRWQGGLDAFAEAWHVQLDKLKALPRDRRDVVLFDDVMYGQGGPIRPSPRQLHARLLALTYDEGWLARLRQHLQQEARRLAVRAPWLLGAGDIETLSGPALLAFEGLLPEARKQLARLDAQAAADEAEAEQRYQQLATDLALTLGGLRTLAQRHWLSDGICQELRESIQHFSHLNGRLRATGRTDPAHLQLRNRVARLEPALLRIEPLAERLLERRAENRGWFNRQTFGFFWVAALLVPVITGSQRLFAPMLVSGGLLALWRLLPNFFTQREIRALARRID